MKKYIQIITVIAVGLNFGIAHAQKETSDLKIVLARDKLSNEEVDEAYNKLETLVEAKTTKTSMKSLLELCLMYFKHDGSDAAYDFVYDLKKSNPEEFAKALEELSKQDKEKIQEFIKVSEDEEKYGNG